jgi:hypothetical protein
MKSSFPLFRVDPAELEGLIDTVQESYKSIAQLIGKLEEMQDLELIIEARNICSRLEAILELLDEEGLSPELGMQAIEGGVDALVTEAESLRIQMRTLASKIQSKSR